MPDDFFAEEQKMAVRAMLNCCRDTWQVIEQDTNIKPLIRQRPLASLAVAATGGLVAGYLLGQPRKRKPEQVPHNGKRNGKTKPKHRSFLLRLEDELAHAVLPVLRTFAASSAGAMFSEIHHGYTNGESHNQQEQAAAPPSAIQI